MITELPPDILGEIHAHLLPEGKKRFRQTCRKICDILTLKLDSMNISLDIFPRSLVVVKDKERAIFEIQYPAIFYLCKMPDMNIYLIECHKTFNRYLYVKKGKFVNQSYIITNYGSVFGFHCFGRYKLFPEIIATIIKSSISEKAALISCNSIFEFYSPIHGKKLEFKWLRP